MAHEFNTDNGQSPTPVRWEVTCSHDQISLGERIFIDFQRTLRIPDDGKMYPLPAGLGRFPVRRVSDYASKVPDTWKARNAFFIPMYQREALWLDFVAGQHPVAIKVALGRVNAVTGEPWDRFITAEKQDYLVCPPQCWLDGFKTGNGVVRQFVAMPLGQGYTVEHQLTGREDHGGIQILVFAAKPGKFAEYCDSEPRHLKSVMPLPDLEMGIASGGKIEQKIYEDEYGYHTWDQLNFEGFTVHIVDSLAFREITGEDPPPSPITAQTYVEYGLPWFDLYDEKRDDVQAYEKLYDIKSTRLIDKMKGQAGLQDDSSIEVPAEKVISINNTSQYLGPIQENGLEVEPLMQELGLDEGAPELSSESKPKFSVFVDDNFHYMDESERYLLGEFDTREEAVEKAKAIVDEFLIRGYEEGMTSEKLHESYRGFGEDPFIMPAGDEERFSAWKYAMSRCEEICAPKPHTDEPQADTSGEVIASGGSGRSANSGPSFSESDVLYFEKNETVCWPCRGRDVVCWLRSKGLFTGEWEILDFWSCTDSDIVTVTNRIEDFPPGFELHPLERKGRLMARELSAEQVDAAEYIEAPNLWKARVGDRILWVGEPRSKPRPIEQILSIVEFSENALVARQNGNYYSDLQLHLDWATGSANEGDTSAYQEAVGRMRHGLEIVKRLGIPGSISESPWGIG